MYWIDVNIKAETADRPPPPQPPARGGYYGQGYRYGYGGGFSTTTINYDTYTDGTMFIDMIDATEATACLAGEGHQDS
ncbi:MAG: hypothetical protein MZV63_49815 [Marinilabiliales bacterium]|nr:hypothetical protein [Marinilabiliales bacterium]